MYGLNYENCVSLFQNYFRCVDNGSFFLNIRICSPWWHGK